MNYWLMKSEPTTCSLEDLKRDGQTCWDGVRNYQARNFMPDDTAGGDSVPSVAGLRLLFWNRR